MQSMKRIYKGLSKVSTSSFHRRNFKIYYGYGSNKTIVPFYTLTQYIHNEKKAELRKKIVRLVEGTILPLFNGNSQNQDYLAFKKAAMEINKTQLQDK